MELIDTVPMSWRPSEPPTSPIAGQNSSRTPVLHVAAPEVRLCLRDTCGHTKLPPISQWAYPLCPPCLEATRLKEAIAKRAALNPPSRRGSVAGTVPAQSGITRPMAPPPAPNIIVVPCHFCPTRVAVPPGQPPNAPLLCKPCFERAIRDKQNPSPAIHVPHPDMVHRQIQRPPPLPRQASLSNQANIRIAHSHSPVTPTFPKRPSMAIPQHPIPSSRIAPSMPPPIPSPRLQHASSSGGPIVLPATPPFLPVATPFPSSIPSAPSTNINGDSDSDDLQLLYPNSDDESMGDPTPLRESITTIGTDATSTKGVETPAPSSTPAIPELWTDELSELSSLESSEDESESDEEPLMLSMNRHRTASSGLKIRIRIPSGFKFGQDQQPPLPSGAPPRDCGVSSCKRKVDANSRWKLCTVCRSKYRKYQRKRIGVVNPRTDIEEEDEPLMAHTQDAEINTAEAAAHASLSVQESRKCSNPWCNNRIPFEHEYEFKQCIRCRVRGRWNVKKRRIISKHYERGKEHVGISTHVINEYTRLKARRRKLGLADDSTLFGSPPGVDDQVTDLSSAKAYPVFQTLKECLLAMRVYTEDFLRAHTLFIRTMLDRGFEGKATTPCGFAFDGEFSIVANWPVRSQKTERLVTEIWQSIEQGLKLKLIASSAPWIDAGALVTRVSCEQPMSLPIPPSEPALLEEAAVVTVQRTVAHEQPTLITGNPPDAGVRGAGKASFMPSEPLLRASPSLPSVAVVEAAHTSSSASIVASSPDGKPTGDLPASSKPEAASSTVAIETLPDVEMVEGNLSSLRAVPRSPEALSLNLAVPADESAGSHPPPSATTLMVDAGSVSGSIERPVEPASVSDGAHVVSRHELSRPLNGSSAPFMDDLELGDAEDEDDDSPSSSRMASPALLEDGPLLPEGVIMQRSMLVEVEVRVSEDKSNRFIPGHRILVRFRLVV